MQFNREDIRRIMVAVNEIEGACALLSKKIGMKENTLTLLYALDDGKPHTQKEICEEWFLPKTTLNTIVKECVDAGYLVLNATTGAREKEICLTEAGREYAARILPAVYELENKAMEDTQLSSETIGSLARFAQGLKEEVKHYTYGA